MGLIGASPRLRGLALRALLDNHLAPGVLCRVPFDDHTLYVDPRDDKIALKLLAGRLWQREMLETAIAVLRARGALRPEGVFVDVGANIGTQSVYAMRSGAFARAIAIEPDPHNFDILVRNLAANGLEDRVEPVFAAASAASGRLQLTRHGRNHGAHSLEAGFVPRPSGSVAVEAMTLDELIRKRAIAPEQVALVKIDVEGHELAVLKGMGELRGAGTPILVEVTARRGDGRAAEFKALLQPDYGHVLDVDDAADGAPAEPHPLHALVIRKSQSDLLVF